MMLYQNEVGCIKPVLCIKEVGKGEPDAALIQPTRANQNSPIQAIGGSGSSLWKPRMVDLNGGAAGKYLWFYTTRSME